MLNLALIGQAVSEKKIFENGGRRTDGRRMDGRTTEHGYTISSPCEPHGSGELITIEILELSLKADKNMRTSGPVNAHLRTGICNLR